MNALKLVTHSNVISELKSIKEQIKALQTVEASLKTEINDILDSNDIEEICIGTDKVKRSISERHVFDTKTFESLHPDLYSQFIKTTAVITLRTI